MTSFKSIVLIRNLEMSFSNVTGVSSFCTNSLVRESGKSMNESEKAKIKNSRPENSSHPTSMDIPICAI